MNAMLAGLHQLHRGGVVILDDALGVGAAAHVLAFCDHLTMYSENAEVNIPRDLDGDSGIDPSVSFPGLG